MKETETPKDGMEVKRPSFVVGIGASAGGLEALEQLFDHLPHDTGMAFVVVQHLSPDFDSLMDELLIRHTKLPVATVEDGMSVEPNSIYLIPPRKQMEISSGRLLLTDKDPHKGLSLPIDIFFSSLAADRGADSIGIILSGTGSDGSRGIRDISAAGGLVLAQTEESAKFDGMPKSAIETGTVDLCLPPAEIGRELAKYAKNPNPGELSAQKNVPPIDETAMAKLLRLLRNAYGIDFNHYKKSTVNRRIERRLMLNHTTDIDAYVEQVTTDPEELNSLYRDLLIGVTQFFRDRDAFQELDQRILPELLQKVSAEEEIRFWVAGCATGEEAYSIAILLHEHLSRLERPLNAKIFATDVHQASLEIAGAGCYDKDRLMDVSSDRLRRYFTLNGGQYQVNSDLRKMIVFAKHNVLKDAPFTRLDLVTCRNLLIYFEPDAQRRILSLFHFGLKPDRILLLGPSEGLAGLEDEFTTLDRQWKIYRKLRDSRILPDIRLPMPTPVTGTIDSSRLVSPAIVPNNAKSGTLSQVYDCLLESCVPAGVLLDGQYKLLYVFGEGGKYLHHGAGKAADSAVFLFESELRTAITGALQRATKQRSVVSYSSIPVLKGDEATKVDLAVRPLSVNGSAPSHFLVTFDDHPQKDDRNSTDSTEAMDIGEVSRERILSLESDLNSTKENLQATIEELEASNEELHATNEELVASNEELQSTNEELHSVNEELYTVNAEYQRKISELSELTDDMDNLLASIDVGVVYLDRELCIRKFTPQAARVFNMLDQDIGRSFETFSNSIQEVDLDQKINAVMKAGQSFELEVLDRSNNWHLLRVLPYSSKSEKTGVVITLIDIATLKKAENELRDHDRQLQGILDHAPAFIYVKDLDGRYVLANRRAKRTIGKCETQLIGLSDFDVLPRNVADHIEAHDRQVATTGETLQVEETIPQKGTGITYLSVKYPLRDEQGRMFAIAGISTDITRRKIAERKAKQAIKQRDRFLAMLSHELRNPLAAVKNGIEVMSRSDLKEPTAQKAANAVKTQADQMARLMDDLLDISRVANGKLELTRKTCDLREVANRSAEVTRSMIAEHCHKFITNFPDEPVYILGDAARLQQVQVNLLVNAAKYTPNPGIITFTLASEGSMAVIRVKDTGLGMTPAMKKKAFKPFFQNQQTIDRSEGGMGIGLTLVQTLVDLHGGDIKIESDGQNQGTEFIVRLPIVSAPEASESQGAAFEQPTGNLKILLVEDNEQLRYTTSALLELEGFTVTTATDGLAAISAFESDKPDVALVDIGLPELDGYGVAQRIRQNDTFDDVYMVALTGYGQQQDLRRAKQAGFDEHITKPFDLDNLRNLLCRVSARRAQSDVKNPTDNNSA